MPRGPGKGNTNNPNGRPKGSVNKAIAPIREKFQQLLDGVGLDLLVSDLNSLEPLDRLKMISSLSEYVTPKLQRSDNTLKAEVTEIQEFIFDGQKVTF